MAIMLDDVSFGVDIAGEGEPVVLLHAFPLNRDMWQAQHGSLCQTCRMIVPDLRGFGESALAHGTVTMEQYADDLAGLLDAIGCKHPVTLCGVSMGGYIALAFAKKYPDRLRGLALCHTKAVDDTDDARDDRERIAADVLRNGVERLVREMPSKMLCDHTLESKPEVVALVREMICSAAPESVAAALHGMAARPDMTSLLAEIGMPTLVLAGEHDQLAPPKMMQEMADEIPDAQFATIDSAAHLSPLENPDAFNGAIRRFLHR
ncbi:alpha/beta fold hydrolase [Stratiformator vulcanicus]|uniref:3-oxoadipate enol-lactonase 2 n=1 Tax=Stratiformator vulcanicus TaxID=2527980 RepID=A0A517R5B2_9PLAN|nr:alpha/beta hydrolase [Stratiformator vulcanicus]QDT39075.1 3-oxoadipate enol-lactonase 2 [Stratiformator vulcanicus]